MPSPLTTRPELLAPAGDYDALVAAVNNGADAVYLGLEEMNARRGAANFDLESLAEATRFAHLRGVNVYLTANTLVLPDEMQAALAMVDAAWAAGVDAVIVQDLGLIEVLRTALPQVRLHASTQLGAMNPGTIEVLRTLGVSRVVLARELPFAAIAECARTGLEIETFVHGALCYAYSGHCLMSSMIGRRSANRGMCAQPCRLPYDLVSPDGAPAPTSGRYLLSPRDNAAIAHLPRLIGAGVSALKIEGRMKSAEYVAIVTGVYRAALDRAWASPEDYSVLPAEWEMLEEAFSRGFTDGYLTGRRGADLMSYSRPNNRGVPVGRIETGGSGRARIRLERAIDAADTLELWTRSGRFAQPVGRLEIDGAMADHAPAGELVTIALKESAAAGDRVFRVANASLLDAARRTFTGHAVIDARATPVDFAVDIRVGRPLTLRAMADGVSVEIIGPEVEKARTKPLSAEAVIEHIGRLGGSGYRVGGLSVDLDPTAGLGYSVLHGIRRAALQQLDEGRLASWLRREPASPTRRVPLVSDLPGTARRPRLSAPRLVATVWDAALAETCLAAGADEVLVRVFGAPSADALGPRVHPLLPRVVWPRHASLYPEWAGREGSVTVGDLGTLAASVPQGVVECDWPLNVVNAHSASVLARLGASLVWASPELSGRQLAALAGAAPVPVGCLVWGRVELMVAEQCVLQAAGECDRACLACTRRRDWWQLVDCKGYRFPVATDPAGRSHIMNAVTLDLTRALDEVVATGVSAVRIDFSDESPARMAEVVSGIRRALTAAAKGASPPSEPLVTPATSGHFYRGVT